MKKQSKKISLENLYLIAIGIKVPSKREGYVSFERKCFAFVNQIDDDQYKDVLFGTKYYIYSGKSLYVKDYQACCNMPQIFTSILASSGDENNQKILKQGYILREELLEWYNGLNKDEELAEKEKQEEEENRLLPDGLLAEKERKQAVEQINLEIQELLTKVASLLKKRKALQNNIVDKISIPEDVFFIEVESHKEINPIFLPYLSFIDMLFYNFTNVKVEGIDFSNSNAVFNPQMIYQKNMSNGVFPENSFLFQDFRGVNLKGTTFIREQDRFPLSITGAITDENTVIRQKENSLELKKSL